LKQANAQRVFSSNSIRVLQLCYIIWQHGNNYINCWLVAEWKHSGELPCFASFAPEQEASDCKRTIGDPQVPSEQAEAICGQQKNSDKKSITERRNARQDRERAYRLSLTSQKREEINARRRARRKNLTLEEREINARRRARIHNFFIF
jgi:hypothetical protein